MPFCDNTSYMSTSACYWLELMPINPGPLLSPNTPQKMNSTQLCVFVLGCLLSIIVLYYSIIINCAHILNNNLLLSTADDLDWRPYQGIKNKMLHVHVAKNCVKSHSVYSRCTQSNEPQT